MADALEDLQGHLSIALQKLDESLHLMGLSAQSADSAVAGAHLAGTKGIYAPLEDLKRIVEHVTLSTNDAMEGAREALNLVMRLQA